MYLDRRNLDRLQRVENRNAGVGIGRGVDDNPVCVAVSRLNAVDDRPFMVGLVQDGFDVLLYTAVINILLQAAVILGTIDVGFAQTEHVDVRSVDDQELQHAFTTHSGSLQTSIHSRAFE